MAENDDATVAEVTEAITNLSDAIANLESIKLDTSALVHEIELVNEMLANIGNYVPSSVEGLADKLADAQNVLENAATQAEIDEAVKMLTRGTPERAYEGRRQRAGRADRVCEEP